MLDKTKLNLPFLLVIIDGLALNPNPKGNAFSQADTPTLDNLFKNYPNTALISHGKRVGLPAGQMGNSEVGHLNIGAGRVVQQQLTKINQALGDKELENNNSFVSLCKQLKTKPDSALHLIGLSSEGGVHSQLDHLKSIIIAALEQGLKKIYIHAITDGRDRSQSASLEDIKNLQDFLQNNCQQQDQEVAIVSLIGRFLAMDRDNRWERVEKAYNLYTLGEGAIFNDPFQALKEQETKGITAEFIEPHFIDSSKLSRKPIISDGDGIIFYNYRADRMREIVSTFFGSFDKFSRKQTPKIIKPLTLTEYDPNFDVTVLFPPQIIKNYFGQVVANAGLSQLRIAETEKYPHVTYFFNGGEETPTKNEERKMIPSPREVTTYDQKPEMSAPEITTKIIEHINNNKNDVYILNFANCDMVGHTGNFAAAVKAVETVDRCLGEILTALEAKNGCAIITADHGNADQMIDYETNEPHTYHTTYPVPFILFGNKFKNCNLRLGGALCDITPTACEMIGLNQPEEMTGQSLID